MYALLIQGLSTKVSNAKLTRCVIFALHVGNTFNLGADHLIPGGLWFFCEKKDCSANF